MQFQDVGASDATTTIAKITSQGIIAGSYDTMETEAPCIMIFNGVGYDYYYYITDAYDADGNEVTAWATAGGDEANISESIGTGFWLDISEKNCTTGTLTIAGEVNNEASTDINIASGLTLAGNPYPSAMDFTKITTTGIEPGSYDTMETEAPCIMIFNGVGYDYYYYITDAYDADGNEVTAWATAGGDEAGVVSNPGEGFWSRSPVAGKLTFARPF